MEGITRVRSDGDGGVIINRSVNGHEFGGRFCQSHFSDILFFSKEGLDFSTQEYTARIVNHCNTRIIEFNVMWLTSRTATDGIDFMTYANDTFFLDYDVLLNFFFGKYPEGTIHCPQKGGGEDA